MSIAFLILTILALGSIMYELYQPALRISHVQIYGADQSLANYAYAAMQGKYLGIIPRDSTFFFPESSIRRAILADHPELAAVSIFRDGFTGLSIKPSERVGIARWCGVAPMSAAQGLDEYCYVFDANGYIFAAASSTEPIQSFILYAPLLGNAEEPVGTTLANADKLPYTFEFARELSSFRGSVTRIIVRSDEVDQYLSGGTRITYVLGDEQNAYTALVAAKDKLNLANGSLDYVDLRFDGKMYLKKK